MLTHHYFPHIGGNGVQCKLLAEELQKLGYNITIITKRYRSGLASYEVIQNIDVHRIFCLSAIFNKSVPDFLLETLSVRAPFKLLVKILARLFFYADELIFSICACIRIVQLNKKIDIVHVHQSHWIAYCGVIAASLTKKPIVVKDATLNGFNELKVMPFARKMCESIKKTAYFAAISTDIYNNLVDNGVLKDRIFLAPNGVQLPPFVNNPEIDSFDVLFVGNFNQGKIKGLDVLIRAIPAVLQEFPAIRLLILGKGDTTPYLKIIKENNIQSDKIEFMGKREARDFYLKCAVFVLPSRSEGMSNALLEAMSYSMACVSTNISGSNDLIINRINGLLIQAGNVRQLEEALLYLFSNREFALQLGKNARMTIIDKFQMDKVAKRYTDIYQTILDYK